MRHLIFYREDNNFNDILTDPALKKEYKTKLLFNQHIILGFPEYSGFDKLTSYIMLKYGDDIRTFSSLVPDRTPIIDVDYVPKRKKPR